MPHEFIKHLIDEVYNNWNVVKNIEITLEANPSTRDSEKFEAYLQAGVNRLSIGAQSFHENELQILGRAHSVDEIIETVEIARRAEFKNISLDLVYGIPGQTVTSLIESAKQALELNVEHLSTYSLSIEPDTPFNDLVKNGELKPPDPDLAAKQYYALCRLMRDAGFEHYELTNFAKPDRWSRHNFTYWQRTPYLGIGTGAHSFDGRFRFWNTRDTHLYISSLEVNSDPNAGKELLTRRMTVAEIIYLSLRTSQGLEMSFSEKECSIPAIGELIGNGFLTTENGRYHVPEDRWLLLDEIVLRLLQDQIKVGRNIPVLQ